MKLQDPNSNAAGKKENDLSIERFCNAWQSVLACFHLKGRSSSDSVRAGISFDMVHWLNSYCVWSLWPHQPVLIWAPERVDFGEDWEEQRLKTKTNEQNLKSPSIIHAKKRKVVDNSTTIFNCLWVKKIKDLGGKQQVHCQQKQTCCMFLVPCLLVPLQFSQAKMMPPLLALFSEKHVQCIITVTSDYKNEKCAWKWKPKSRMEKKGVVGWIHLFYVLQSPITFLGQ